MFLFLDHCVEFNVAGGVIQEQSSARCNNEFPKCDVFYKSSTAYKCKMNLGTCNIDLCFLVLSYFVADIFFS